MSTDPIDRALRLLSQARSGNLGDEALKMLVGESLGMPPGAALMQVQIIKGRPTLGAAAQLALAHQAGHRTTWTESTSARAVLSMVRAGTDTAVTTAYTMKEARNAGLGGRAWSSYPAEMLRARCITRAIRQWCPEVLGGALYDPEEIGGDPDLGHADEASVAEMDEGGDSAPAPPRDPEPAAATGPATATADTPADLDALTKAFAALGWTPEQWGPMLGEAPTRGEARALYLAAKAGEVEPPPSDSAEGWGGLPLPDVEAETAEVSDGE